MDRKCKSLVNYTTESSDDEDCNEEMHAAKLKLKDWVNNDSDMDSNFETENNGSDDHDTSDSDAEGTKEKKRPEQNALSNRAEHEDIKGEELKPNKYDTKHSVETQRMDKNIEVNVKEYVTGLIITTMAGKNWYEANKIYRTMAEEFGHHELSTMSKEVILDKAKFILENKMHLKLHICNYCLKKFKNKKDYHDHVRMIHENCPKKYRCGLCEKSYMSEIALRYHKEVVHSDSCPRVKCSVCGKDFGHQTTLKRHMQIHDEKIVEYKCDHCDKRFIRKDELVRHRKNLHRKVEIETDMVKIFKENEKFRCKDCREVLDDKSDMVVHLVHKCKANPCFSCNECGRKCTSKFNLQRHITNVHTNVLPTFSCKSCNFITRFKENLARHVIRTHQMKN